MLPLPTTAPRPAAPPGLRRPVQSGRSGGTGDFREELDRTAKAPASPRTSSGTAVLEPDDPTSKDQPSGEPPPTSRPVPFAIDPRAIAAALLQASIVPSPPALETAAGEPEAIVVKDQPQVAAARLETKPIVPDGEWTAVPGSAAPPPDSGMAWTVYQQMRGAGLLAPKPQPASESRAAASFTPPEDQALAGIPPAPGKPETAPTGAVRAGATAEPPPPLAFALRLEAKPAAAPVEPKAETRPEKLASTNATDPESLLPAVDTPGPSTDSESGTPHSSTGGQGEATEAFREGKWPQTPVVSHPSPQAPSAPGTASATPHTAADPRPASPIPPPAPGAMYRMIDTTADPPPPSSGVARELAIQVETAQQQNVHLRLIDRGGEVHLAVRSGDTDLTRGLQDNLNELVGRLHHQGYEAESWRPAATQGSSNGMEDHSSRHGQPRDHQPQRRDQNNESGNESPKRPRWVEEFETATIPQSQSFRSDIPWLRASIP